MSIVSENNKGINIELTLKLPQVLEIAFVVIMLLQILSLGLIYWGGKKAENFRLQKELDIAQLSLQVAHDIRSPLASLENGLKDIDIPEDNAALIKQSTERIRAIADDLLRKYRRNPKVDNLEGKKEEDIKYTEKTCDLTEIIKKIILEKKAVYKDIEFKVDTPNEKIEIKTDANEISRMVSNLINNSVEAMAGDKSQIRVYNQVNQNITIRLRKEEDKAVIIIKDNGKGIPKEIIKRLGEKGFSVGKENGNGLGLWHAKTLTESLGGSLEISSETNLGTEIRIILPVLNTNSIIPVVLIDDDPLVRKNWEIKSRKNGINLKTYANPIDFIETSHNYPKETQIYIDSELGNDIKGEEIAKELYEKGFKNIYIETGYSKDRFKGNQYIKDIISKEPPF
ncbi:MAG: HAMP domain-containing histidine kinase [Elusimicrobiales bacterium]|nr:HAMP domain-containing histidine kinase [Elusimicrobiales bacterium]